MLGTSSGCALLELGTTSGTHRFRIRRDTTFGAAERAARLRPRCNSSPGSRQRKRAIRPASITTSRRRRLRGLIMCRALRRRTIVRTIFVPVGGAVVHRVGRSLRAARSAARCGVVERPIGAGDVPGFCLAAGRFLHVFAGRVVRFASAVESLCVGRRGRAVRRAVDESRRGIRLRTLSQPFAATAVVAPIGAGWRRFLCSFTIRCERP